MSEPDRQPLLERLGLHRRELRAWALYDLGNSAVMTTVIAAVFPIYFTAVPAAELPRETALWIFGLVTSLAVIGIGIVSPLLGALADVTALRKRLLAVLMVIGTVGVMGMFFVEYGDWKLALLLFAVANVGLAGSFVFYDALLPHIAKGRELDRVSTSAYALGYLGGGVLLALNLAWIAFPGVFGLPESDDPSESARTLPVRLALVSAAVWWVAFSVPLFLRVPEPQRRLEPGESAEGSAVRAALARLRRTFRELRSYRHAFVMLIAFLLYSDGIATIIRMAAIYGATLGLDRDAMVAAILITQLVGVPCAFLFGALAGRIGARSAVLIGLCVYMGITVLAYFMTSVSHFLMLAILVGMVQGGTQALSRSMFARMIPRHRSGEFFGLYGVMDRFAGSGGTLVMALVVALTGDPRLAILTVLIPFVAGALLITRVDVAAGERAARDAERSTSAA